MTNNDPHPQLQGRAAEARRTSPQPGNRPAAAPVPRTASADARRAVARAFSAVTRKRALPVAVLLAVLTLPGCGTAANSTAQAPAASGSNSPPSPAPSPSPSSEPETYDGVKAAVDALDAAAAHLDGAALWDMLTSTGQAAMSRADYIKVTKGCPKIVTATKTLSIALNAAGTTATVTVSAPPAQGGTYTYNMIYENGHWKHQPSDGALEWMGLGADKALATMRNAGAC
jgi:hypothetical protein